MSGRSGTDDGKGTSPSRYRGQSEVVGIILLFGIIVVGAVLTIAVGGMALQSIQENAEGGLAQDTAVQAHAALSEVATTGETRALPVGEGAVDARYVDGGNLTISMYNATTGTTCSAVDEVDENLGALRYEGGDRAMIYEGGAIWAESAGGLAIERAPPISHGADGTRISVLSVAGAATTADGRLVARPDESARTHIASRTDELLTRCPAEGYTSLRINVTSPYADGWERHFQTAVETTPNVDVTRSAGSDTVVAEIENATAPPTTGGLALSAVDAPTVIAPGDEFTVEANVSNDDFDAANATVELDLTAPGISRSSSVNVSSFAETRTNVTVDAATIDSSLSQGTSYDYTVTVRNESGDVASTADGSFTFGTDDPMVRLDAVDDALDAGDDALTVTATLRNDGLKNGTGAVTLDLADPAINASPQPSGPVNVSSGGTTDVAFGLDASALPMGTYQYAVDGPNGTITDTFTIANRTASGPMAGDVRIADVDPSDTELAVGDGFDTTVSLENVANATESADVTLDVAGGPAETRSVSLGPGGTDSVTPAIDASAIDDLEPGTVHDYSVTLAAGGETETLNGSFYLGNAGDDLGVASTSATNDDGSVTVSATLSNVGLANGTDAATLSLTAADGTPVDFATTPEQSVSTSWGSTSTVTFDLDLSELSGNHTYTVEYGGDAASGSLDLGGINHTNSSVGISGGGTGTVRVFGTEISAETDRVDHWDKYWSPTSVSVLQETDGIETTHEFQNDDGDVEDPRNLNSYDTQEEIYTYDWHQDADESTTLTIQSTWWGADGGRELVNERTEHGRHWDDLQPEDGLDYIERRVDADAGQNPENVRVLTDGDQVPRVSGVNPDQRNASEVLNQGAADRIDPDTGELTLAPNEAVFLFEMTTTPEDEPGDDMWEYALNNDVSDPDYNDVIAIVEFEPDGTAPVPVAMNTTDDGSGLVITTPGVSGPGTGTVSAGSVNATAGDGMASGFEPVVPDTAVGSPTPPEDVEVEVDVVQLS